MATINKRERCGIDKVKLAIFLVALFVICALIFCWFNRASIANGFGIGEAPDPIKDVISQTSFTSEPEKSESDILKDSNKRDVNNLFAEIQQEEEQKIKEEQEKARIHDEECIARGISAKKKAGNPNDGVDFSIGREAFITTWAPRIDAYLAGYPLAGQGITFANAAFEYGIDPRMSPAISNTESTRGQNCFKPHNAWGWMSGIGWSDWESAINAHVKGMAEGYGYTITLGVAKKYCPPTYEEWYAKTKAQLDSI